MLRNRGNCSRLRLPSRSNLHSDVFKALAFAAEYP